MLTVAEQDFAPGERIAHHEFGQGVVVDPARDGYFRAFFGVGERRVPLASVRRQQSRTERVLARVDGTPDTTRWCRRNWAAGARCRPRTLALR